MPTFRIDNEHGRVVALKYIEELRLDKKYEVKVQSLSETRSIRQNSLYWEWVTIIAKEIGNTKEEQHEDFKSRILVPIFIRDDEEFATMWHSLRDVWRAGLKDEAQALRKKIIKMVSTTHCSTKQMAEYMGQIDIESASLHINLPRPDDIMELID